MIASFDNVQKIGRLHLRAHLLEQVERTKRVARPLHEKNRRCLTSAKLRRASCPGPPSRKADSRDKSRHSPFPPARDGTRYGRPCFCRSRTSPISRQTFRALRQRGAMGSDQLRQSIRPFAAFAHVVVIEVFTSPISCSRDFHRCIHGCEEGAPAPGAKRKKMALPLVATVSILPCQAN